MGFSSILYKLRSIDKSNVLLALFGLFLALIILEIAVGIWYQRIASIEQIKKFGLYTQVPDSCWQIKPHHYLNYTLSPNYRNDSMNHNSLGYRGKEFSQEKPKNIFRIVALGGSTTYTANVNNDDLSFPAQLETQLKEKYNYQNIEVINAGVPGYNSWESLINLEFRVIDLAPDLVIIYHGTNDVHTRLIPPEIYQSDNSGFRTQFQFPEISIYDRSALLRLLRRKLGFSQQIGLDPLVIRKYPGMLEWRKAETLKKNEPHFFERNLINMIAICEAHHIQPVLATWAWSHKKKDYASIDYFQKGFRENNKTIKSIGKNYNIPLFDFEGLMPKDREHWSDGRHVNEKGALLKASLFAEYLHQSNLIPNQ